MKFPLAMEGPAVTTTNIDRVVRIVERLGIATVLAGALLVGAWKITEAQMRSVEKLQDAFITQFAAGQDAVVDQLRAIDHSLQKDEVSTRQLEQSMGELRATIEALSKKPRGNDGVALPADLHQLLGIKQD